MKSRNALTSIPRSTLGVILALAVLVVLLGWNYFAKPFEALNQEVTETVTDIITSPLPGATPAPTSFSPEEAVAQVLAYPVVVTPTVPSISSTSATPSTLPSVLQADDVEWLAQYRPAMVTLFGSRISSPSARLATGEIRAAYGDRGVLIAVDHEGGTTQRLNGPGFTILPSWQALCSQTGEAASTGALILGDSLAEVKQAGVDIVLAPVVDVGTSSVLRSRICSSDPGTVVENAARFISLAQGRHLTAVLKHFPGIGSSTRDLHTTFDQVTVTAQDAQVYQQLLGRFPNSIVMVTHIGITNQLAEVPCTYNKDCIDELKRNYPQTLVMSDALDMAAAARVPTSTGTIATTSATLSERAIAAINAGNQVLLFGQSVTPQQMETVYKALLDEYRNNISFKAQIDTAANRVFELQKQVIPTSRP